MSEIQEPMEDHQAVRYKKLSSYLARVEHFCCGLQMGIYDFDTFYNISQGYFDNGGKLYYRLLPIIEAKSIDAQEEYFKNIYDVWRRMENKSKKRKGL